MSLAPPSSPTAAAPNAAPRARQRETASKRKGRWPWSQLRGNRRRRGAKTSVAGEGNAAVLLQQTEPLQREQRKPHMPSRMRSWRAVPSLLAGTLVVVLVGGAGYVGYRRFVTDGAFLIKRVVIEGVSPTDAAPLQSRLKGLRGRSLLSLALGSLAEAIKREQPWIAELQLRRVLPDTVRVQVQPQVARAAVNLEQLYLVNAAGQPFKRAQLAEVQGLPIITGVERQDYVRAPQRQQQRIQHALVELARYQQNPKRPVIGEIHVGNAPADALTFYVRDGGTALRLGASINEQQLAKLDVVWAALGASASQAEAIYLDHRTHTDRVIVRMPTSEAATE